MVKGPLQSRQQNNKHLATVWVSKTNGYPVVSDKLKDGLDCFWQLLQEWCERNSSEIHYFKILWYGIDFRQGNCSCVVSGLRRQLAFQVSFWRRICEPLYESNPICDNTSSKEIYFQNWRQNQQYGIPGPFATDGTRSNLFLALISLSREPMRDV